MRKRKSETCISQRDLKQRNIDNSQDSANAFYLLFVYFLIATSLLILLFSDTDIEIPKIKISTERSSLILFYANVMLLVNSLLSGGLTAITDADILEAVGRVPITQMAIDVSSHSMNSMSLTNLD